jgi:biopolymer transport protein ExbB
MLVKEGKNSKSNLKIQREKLSLWLIKISKLKLAAEKRELARQERIADNLKQNIRKMKKFLELKKRLIKKNLVL